MHFSYTGSLGLLIPLAALSRAEDALVHALLAVFLWLLVAVLALCWPRLAPAARGPMVKNAERQVNPPSE